MIINTNYIVSLNPSNSYLKEWKEKYLHLECSDLSQFLDLNIAHKFKIWLYFKLIPQEKIRFIAADFAESTLSIYENNYPGDNRLRLAIEETRRPVLNIDAINSAANAANSAANSAADSAYSAAYSAYSAVDSAYSAANSAANSATNAAYSATNAATNAANAANAAYSTDGQTAEEAKQILIMKKYIKIPFVIKKEADYYTWLSGDRI